MTVQGPGAIVVGVASEDDTAAAALAAAEAALHGRPLTVLHTVDEQTARGVVRAEAALRIRFQRVAGSLDEALIHASRDALLVVTSAAGDRLAGARRVAAHSGCPALMVAGRTADSSAPVMLAVDARSGVPRAGAFAFREANLRHVELSALYVTEEIPGGALDTVDPFAYDSEAALDAADRLLAEALAGHGEAYPDVAVRRRVWHDPALVSALAARAEKAALLVVAARDHPRMSERMLGTVTAGLLEAAPCPLVIVPARGRVA